MVEWYDINASSIGASRVQPPFPSGRHATLSLSVRRPFVGVAIDSPGFRSSWRSSRGSGIAASCTSPGEAGESLVTNVERAATCTGFAACASASIRAARSRASSSARLSTVFARASRRAAFADSAGGSSEAAASGFDGVSTTSEEAAAEASLSAAISPRRSARSCVSRATAGEELVELHELIFSAKV